MGVGPRWRDRRRRLALAVVLTLGLAACFGGAYGAPEITPLEPHELPIVDLDEEAERYCRAQTNARRYVLLYRAMYDQAMAAGDGASAEWLRHGWFGGTIVAAVGIAEMLDPRDLRLHPDQEASRPELIARVCERCPEATAHSGDADTDVFAIRQRPPLCEVDDVVSGVWTERGVDTIHDTWQSVWILQSDPDGGGPGAATWELLTPSGQVIVNDEVGPGSVVSSGAAVDITFPGVGGGTYRFEGRVDVAGGATPQLVGQLSCQGCVAGTWPRSVRFEFSGTIG